MKRFAIAIAALLVATGSLCAADSMVRPSDQIVPDYPHMPSRAVGTVAEAKAAHRAMTELHARLVAEQVEIGVANAVRVEPTRTQLDELAAEAAPHGRLKVGVDVPLGVDIRFQPRAVGNLAKNATLLRHGAARRTGDAAVWTMAIEAPGASGVRIHLTGLDLPAGAELAVYDAGGDAFTYGGRGPMSDGELWTNTAIGDTAILQLKAADLAGISFRIESVGYLGDAFLYGARESLAKSFCSYNADCVVNANCGGASSAVNAARNAVGHMLFQSRGSYYICSGGLVNNDAGRPYFLTANHCISKDREASTLEAYFFYEIPCGDDCGAYARPATPRTLGSSIVATNRTGDYTLLELSGSAPSGAVLLGWDATPITGDDGYRLYRISHPGGAPQAYSAHEVDATTGTCSSWPRGSWIYEHDLVGATEGGSSGSPVVNSNGDIVGQLSGGCGYNLGDVCDSASNATVDGAFASYYGEVKTFLGGGTSCVPSPEICDDGIDNDCDNLVDSFDPDCAGGQCLPKGDSCSSNAECCSQLCHPVKGTCK
jgi:V8-like Glu-specific endopeptidase